MILEYLSENRVIIDYQAVDYQHLLEQMVMHSTMSYKKLNNRSLVDLVLERDSLMPTALGKGVALPRVIDDEIKPSEIIIAINPKGMTIDSMDRKPVKIVFLFLLSTKDNYAELLAQGLRLLNDDNVRDELLQAKTVDRVLKLIQRWEQS